jgi:hypothetical protein
MKEQKVSAGDYAVKPSAPCHFFRFGLIVTGKGEEKHLPKLFKSLEATGMCHFKVIRFINQRGRITTEQQARMVSNGQVIPDKDEDEIGLPARRYLRANLCHAVLVVDDLEHDRREHAQQIFDRYRLILDTMLITDAQKRRAAMHFLVNMLEAYYFADAQAINEVLGLALDDYDGDVETIRNPKRELKNLHPGFDEAEDGGKILERLNVELVLSRPDACVWLRTMFAWCVKVLGQYSSGDLSSLAEEYRLNDGALSPVTRTQLDNLNQAQTQPGRRRN